MTDRIKLKYLLDIPWEGAPLIAPSGQSAAYLTPGGGIDLPDRFRLGSRAPGAYIQDAGWQRTTGDWYLRLDDEEGLGLAGLAAQAAFRLGLDKGRHIASITPWTINAHWLHRQLPNPGLGGDEFTQLVKRTQYLALTDRLSGALRLEEEFGPLPAHGVCTFKLGGAHPPDASSGFGWMLYHPSGEGMGVGVTDAEHSDWLPAIEAALERRNGH